MYLSLYAPITLDEMLDFICKGPVELQGTWSKQNLQNDFFLSTIGFEPAPGMTQLKKSPHYPHDQDKSFYV